MYNDLVERMANGMDTAVRRSITTLARAYRKKGTISVAAIVSSIRLRFVISFFTMYMQ